MPKGTFLHGGGLDFYGLQQDLSTEFFPEFLPHFDEFPDAYLEFFGIKWFCKVCFRSCFQAT